MTPPTLDLFGGPQHALRRPRRAAAAMACFASGQALLLLGRTMPTLLHKFWTGDPLTQFRVDSAAHAIATVPFLAGLVLLGIANVARGHVNAAPRRLLLLTGLFHYLLTLLLLVMFVVALDPGRRYATFLSFGSSLPLWLVGLSAGSLTWLLSLVYALQIANWLGNRPFAILSALVLGLQFAFTSAALIQTTRWYLNHWSIRPNPAIDIILNIAGTVSSILLLCYFLLLTLRLARKT